ncbi:MAG: ABC transporter ATP-binding protein [Pseudomonadota bacterium]
MPPDDAPESQTRFGVGVFAYSRDAIALVWSTSKPLTLWLGALTIIAGLLPAAMAWVGKLIVDSVVLAVDTQAPPDAALGWVAVEAGLFLASSAAQRAITLCQSLLRAQLGHRVNVMILDKALTLSMAQFEDASFYDKLTRARREASSRPLSLVNRTFALIRNGISLISYAILLAQFSLWAVAVLLLAGVPSFLAETKFSGDAFRLFRWRSPDSRKQMYLETVLAREDHVKEVKLFQLGPMFLQRYRDIFARLFTEDRALTIRRESWGFALGIISLLAFYLSYGWIAIAAAAGTITLGQMTMYLLIFKQGQAAVSASLASIGGMYEDNLYLSNLYEYLDQPSPVANGRAQTGKTPGSGLELEHVSFTYPGADTPALVDINLAITPGQSLALVGENGAGKTTLIKLLTGLYAPDEGVIKLDGTPLPDWSEDALLRRFGVIFQDFTRYQMSVGENIGAGDVRRYDDRERWQNAAEQGMAAAFVERMPDGFDTQLGRWFAKGQELSVGQWQKIALSRAFMRTEADVLILDEPTAAMDAAAEADMFEHFRTLTRDKITILISHRFSTVRRADHIVVMDQGHIAERGSHEALMQANARYARLFTLQAEGYR